MSCMTKNIFEIALLDVFTWNISYTLPRNTWYHRYLPFISLSRFLLNLTFILRTLLYSDLLSFPNRFVSNNFLVHLTFIFSRRSLSIVAFKIPFVQTIFFWIRFFKITYDNRQISIPYNFSFTSSLWISIFLLSSSRTVFLRIISLQRSCKTLPLKSTDVRPPLLSILSFSTYFFIQHFSFLLTSVSSFITCNRYFVEINFDTYSLSLATTMTRSNTTTFIFPSFRRIPAP